MRPAGPYALITMVPERAALLARRVEFVAGLQTRLPDLYCLEEFSGDLEPVADIAALVDDNGCFRDAEIEIPQDDDDDEDGCDYIVLPDGLRFDPSAEDKKHLRVGLETRTVTGLSVYWEVQGKQSGVGETHPLYYHQLLVWAGKLTLPKPYRRYADPERETLLQAHPVPARMTPG